MCTISATTLGMRRRCSGQWMKRVSLADVSLEGLHTEWHCCFKLCKYPWPRFLQGLLHAIQTFHLEKPFNNSAFVVEDCWLRYITVCTPEVLLVGIPVGELLRTAVGDVEGKAAFYQMRNPVVHTHSTHHMCLSATTVHALWKVFLITMPLADICHSTMQKRHNMILQLHDSEKHCDPRKI